MGFREALDLGHIVDRYEALGGKQAVNYVDGNIGMREEQHEPIPQRLYEPAPRLGSGEDPDLVGAGPRHASTARSLRVHGPLFSWDVNGYYRELGIPWPYVNATRKDLRLAFHEVNGMNDRRLTYCMKQLLNPVVRAEYDAMPLGEQYLNDDYVQDALKAQIADEASKRSGKGDYVTVEDLLEEKGYVLRPDEESPDEVIDEDRLKRQDEPTVGDAWQYAFYLWRSTSWDAERLSRWQSGLIAKISGEIPTLVVGVMGKQPHRFAIGQVNGDVVVFLNRDEDVTDELVEAAATALRSTMISALNPSA